MTVLTETQLIDSFAKKAAKFGAHAADHLKTHLMLSIDTVAAKLTGKAREDIAAAFVWDAKLATDRTSNVDPFGFTAISRAINATKKTLLASQLAL